MEDCGKACIYVSGQVKGMSMTKGFTPTQCVMGRSPNQGQSLTGDLFSPTVDALDMAGEFANVQRNLSSGRTPTRS